jgi:probable F420-dependent oxidoreductase
MHGYLDALDAADPPVAPDQRIIAALGPKMLELARDRSLGSHPYLSTPEHTQIAREALGPGKLLAPEMAVLLDSDPARARATARESVGSALQMPNYSGNLKRANGFEDADFAGGCSNRLIDSVVAWGDEEAIKRRVQDHFDAGADHVCIQVAVDYRELSRETLRRLAVALID